MLAALRDLDVPVILFGDRNLASQNGDLAGHPFHDLGASGTERLRPGMVDASYGKIALDSIEAALHAVDAGECSALVTAPIHKQSVAAAGSLFPGHTELLASRAGLSRYAHDYAMYFDSPTLRSVLLSVHLPLHEAVTGIAADDIAGLAALMTREYVRLYGREPSIAVAAVNPHGGEAGRFGHEEEEIARGVALAAANGFQVSGPHPADTLFRAAASGRYDVVMAMYHDQALIPIKTIAFDCSVNVTIGLPYLRVSVDHGTAFDIAGKGVADAKPMRYAIQWAAAHAVRMRR